MANAEGFKKIADQRLKTVDILIGASDWGSAVEEMGYVLECTLKAATCRILGLEDYPENTGKKKIDSFFMTHVFDHLIIVSGMSKIFSVNGDSTAFRNWSDFIIPTYQGDWTSMRYDPEKSGRYDAAKVGVLYNNLKEIIRVIER